MGLTFEWDSRKAESNRRKHRVTFHEAASAFGDPASVTIADPDHSEREARSILLGRTQFDRLVVVVHVERREVIRIISARPATRAEQRTYEEG